MTEWNIAIENNWKKDELRLKKMKMKILNILCKIARDCTF